MQGICWFLRVCLSILTKWGKSDKAMSETDGPGKGPKNHLQKNKNPGIGRYRDEW